MAARAQKKNTKRTAAAAGSTTGKTQKKRTTAKNTQNVKKHTKKSGTNSTKRKSTGKKGNTVRKEPEKNSQIWDEVFLWMVLAVSVLAFLSNLGLGGSVGSAVSNALFGIFGILAYAVPVLLFFLFAFLILNKKNKIAWIKVIGILILLIVLCAFMELIPNGYQQTKSLIDYYNVSAAQKSGGGIIGGVIGAGCCPTIGVAGTYVILFLFTIIAFILLTEKSLFRGIEKGSKKVYHSAKEESAHYRELWENKKRQYQIQREEERAERENYWQEEETHGVANIILQDNYPIQEEEEDWSDTEDWLEIEAEYHNKKRQKDFREEMIEEAEEEKTEELEMEEPEEYREEMQKNFWEKEERQQEPIQVEIEEIDLLEEPEMAQKQENIDEIFVPQCRMTEAEHQEEIEESREEYDDTISLSENLTFSEDTPQDIQIEEPETDFIPEEVRYQESQEERKEAEREDIQAVQHRRRERTEMEENVTQVQAEIKGEVQQERQKYQFPPMDLLNLPKGNKKSQDMQELKETAMKLQQTLYSFGVHANVIDASCGPSVTRYELQPEQGVKVSRIVNLADDIKLNLAAADIRIEAPIPGKAAVGIEVPNKENSTVFLRELLESENFQNHPSNIVFAAGKDIGGKTVVTDIGQMPHLLIAGATGSGKSVCINTIIISLLYKADPEDVKLILIDPKVVELSIYNGIPHLMIPVVTDPKKAAGALNWAVAEMTERYNKFAVMGVRDLKGYNQKVASIEQIEDENKPKKMPQIVIIVDELADLMMVAQNDVEEAIQRLTQLARAAGIHLIIATQRPSVNVITGVIKANMPSRIAFSVSSGVDSRTILDMNGAEKLLGKGDMLFFPQGIPKPVRVQGAFVSDKEVSDVVNFITSQNMPCYAKEMEKQINLSQTGSQSGQESGSDWDVYFADAGKIVIEREKASIGMLQRALKVGFNRAARIMDQLYEAGVVGEEEGTKPRKVLMSMEQFEQYIEEYI